MEHNLLYGLVESCTQLYVVEHNLLYGLVESCTQLYVVEHNLFYGFTTTGVRIIILYYSSQKKGEWEKKIERKLKRNNLQILFYNRNNQKQIHDTGF